MFHCKSIAALSIAALFLTFSFSPIALASTPLQEDEIPVLKASTHSQSALLTIFGDGITFVRDRRQVDLEKGWVRLEFENLSERFDPTSVQLQAFVNDEPVLAFEVLEQSFEYNLLDKHNLPQSYLGRELLLERRVWVNGNRATRRERAVLAQLDGANMIFKTADGFEIGPPDIERIIFPQRPDGLRTVPSFQVLLDVLRPGPALVELSYTTPGLSWQMQYRFEWAPDTRTGRLVGLAQVRNTLRTPLERPFFELVNSRFQDRLEGRSRQGAIRTETYLPARLPQASVARPPFVERIFEYTSYKADSPAALKPREVKLVKVFESHPVQMDLRFATQIIIGRLHGGTQYTLNDAVETPATIFASLENSAENGLGFDLAPGRIRIYEVRPDETRVLIAEQEKFALPKKRRAEFAVGTTQDLTVEMRLKKAKKIGIVSIFDPRPVFDAVYAIRAISHHGPAKDWKLELRIPGDHQIKYFKEGGKKRNELMVQVSDALYQIPLEFEAAGERNLEVKVRNSRKWPW